MIDEIEMEKDCPKEDLRKKFHLEWEAFVEDFRLTLCPEDKAYLLMEEKKYKKEKEVNTKEMEKKKAEKDPKTEEMEEKKNYKDWKAKNAKRPVIDID